VTSSLALSLRVSACLTPSNLKDPFHPGPLSTPPLPPLPPLPTTSQNTSSTSRRYPIRRDTNTIPLFNVRQRPRETWRKTHKTFSISIEKAKLLNQVVVFFRSSLDQTTFPTIALRASRRRNPPTAPSAHTADPGCPPRRIRSLTTSRLKES
jgi:hypothetical protein